MHHFIFILSDSAGNASRISRTMWATQSTESCAEYLKGYLEDRYPGKTAALAFLIEAEISTPEMDALQLPPTQAPYQCFVFDRAAVNRMG